VPKSFRVNYKDEDRRQSRIADETVETYSVATVLKWSPALRPAFNRANAGAGTACVHVFRKTGLQHAVDGEAENRRVAEDARILVPGGVSYQQPVCFQRQADPYCWRHCFRFHAIFSDLLTDCRRDLTVGGPDTRMRLGTVIGSLPPRDRHMGCCPWFLGFLFARTMVEVRVKTKKARPAPPSYEVDST
jgi:hypothetical protein